jgi:hypothetical protein
LGNIQLGASLLASKNLPATNFVPLQLGQTNFGDNFSINVMMPNRKRATYQQTVVLLILKIHLYYQAAKGYVELRRSDDNTLWEHLPDLYAIQEHKNKRPWQELIWKPEELLQALTDLNQVSFGFYLFNASGLCRP